MPFRECWFHIPGYRWDSVVILGSVGRQRDPSSGRGRCGGLISLRRQGLPGRVLGSGSSGRVSRLTPGPAGGCLWLTTCTTPVAQLQVVDLSSTRAVVRMSALSAFNPRRLSETSPIGRIPPESVSAVLHESWPQLATKPSAWPASPDGPTPPRPPTTTHTTPPTPSNSSVSPCENAQTLAPGPVHRVSARGRRRLSAAALRPLHPEHIDRLVCE